MLQFRKICGTDLSFEEFFDAHFGHFWHFDIQDLGLNALAFADDLYLFCRSPHEAQCMLDDIVAALRAVDLSLNTTKCQWLIDAHSLTGWSMRTF